MGKKITPSTEKIRRGRVMRFGLLIRDFELHTAVDDIAFQPIQADDFLIAAAVAEILLGDCPEGVTMHHGVDAVILGRVSCLPRQAQRF